MNHAWDIILTVQNYVHENLTVVLTLEKIAEQVYVSPFWLSRLYHKQTGETVMGYVRKQRMRRAAYELLYMGVNIMELAFKFGYDSPDGFSRAFKLHYGMSPIKYRKSGGRIQTDIVVSKLEKEETGMYELWIYEKLNCTRDEKREMFSLVDELLHLASKAKQFGLFELEKEARFVSNPLLKKGIELMIDGTEPAILKKILLNHLLCGNKQKKDCLEGILIMEGVLCIQQGWHQNLIKETLLSYLGGEMMEDVEIHYHKSDDYRADLIRRYMEGLSQEERNESTHIMDDPIDKMNERCLQRLLRELDYEMIAVALKGSNKKIQEKILNNVSPRLAVMMIESINSMTKISSTDIVEAQKSVAEMIKLLVKQGEIIV